jgi:phage-related protein (TIGR01555 family)
MTENRTEQGDQQAGSGVGSGRTAGGQFAEGASGNRRGRPRRDSARADAQRLQLEALAAQPRAESRFDGWFSLLTGLGTLAKDKRESMQFAPDIIDWLTAENIWRGDDLASRIIETLPNEMIREGFDLCITDDSYDDGVGPDGGAEVAGPDEGGSYSKRPSPVGQTPAEKSIAEFRKTFSGGMDPDTKKEVEHQWEELGLMDAIWEALCYERAYGGAAILIGAQDGATDLEQPLVTGSVRSVDFLTVMEPREIQPVLWYGDPRAKKFGKPAVYQLTPITPGNTYQLGPGAVRPRQVYANTVRIHESRLIVFGGIRVSRRLTAVNGGWGDSILTRVWRILRDYNLSWGAAGSLVCDFAQAVYKMKGLNDLLQEDKEDLFKRRMLGMEMARSVARATMIDGEDEFTRIVTPIAGLPDLLDRFTQRLCMCARLPLPLLAGESPGGLNASGASGDQLRMFYDSAKSEQKRKIVPVIRRVTQLIMQALIGGEPAQWTIEPRALWQPTQKEQIETRKIQCDIDCAYLDRGVNGQQEIRDSRFGGKTYSFETKLIKDDPATQPTDDDVAQYAAEQRAAQDDAKKGALAPDGVKPSGVAPPKPAQSAAGPARNPAGAVPSSAGPMASGPDIQKQAMNGAQITSLLEVLTSVNGKQISRESGAAVLRLAFQLSTEDADEILGPEDFEPQKPDPAPAPFGGPPPPPPGAPKPPAPPAGPKPPTPPAKSSAPTPPAKPGEE